MWWLSYVTMNTRATSLKMASDKIGLLSLVSRFQHSHHSQFGLRTLRLILKRKMKIVPVEATLCLDLFVNLSFLAAIVYICLLHLFFFLAGGVETNFKVCSFFPLNMNHSSKTNFPIEMQQSKGKEA